MSVKIRWRELRNFENDEAWHCLRCLYAYTTKNADEILYIGKADRNSIYQRWQSHKRKLLRDLEEQRVIYDYCAFIGELELEAGQKFSWQLLSDVESLLITCEQPWGNIQCRNTRISRPNLEVRCVGNWIGNKFYLDK